MINILKSKIRTILAIISIIILISVFYQNKIRSTAKKTETTIVKKGSLEQKLTISGAIDAEEKATLKFQTSGLLSFVGVKAGDYVKKNQLVASLDQREIEKHLKKKLLAYMNNRWDFDQIQDDKSVRGRRIYQVPGLTDAERRFLDKAQFNLDSTVLDVEITALAKEFSFLRTPIEGIVTAVGSPYPGVNITPDTAEFVIINPRSVYFSALADQTEVISLVKHMTGKLKLDSYPSRLLSGFIYDISFTPKANETSTLYEIKFTFPVENIDYKYKPGMAGDASFVTQSKENVLYVPNKFIKSQNGRKFLKILRNGKKVSVYINTGIETDSDTEITSEVSAGETIYD